VPFRSCLSRLLPILLISWFATEVRGACPVNLQLSISGMEGTATASVSGGCSDIRNLKLYLDGRLLAAANCEGSSCSKTVTFSTACMKTGTHEVSAVGGCTKLVTNETTGIQSCQLLDSGESTRSFVVNSTPEVDLSVTQADSRGISKITMGYSFPNTDWIGQRRLRWQFVNPDGGGYSDEGIFEEASGTWEVEILTGCWTKPHTVLATAFACGGLSPTTYPSDPAFIDQETVELPPPDPKPEVSGSVVHLADGSGRVRVEYSFPYSEPLKDTALEIIDPDGVVIHRVNSRHSQSSGSYESGFWTYCWRSGTYTLRTFAWSCGSQDPAYLDVHETPIPFDPTPEIRIGDLQSAFGTVYTKVFYDFPDAAEGRIKVELLDANFTVKQVIWDARIGEPWAGFWIPRGPEPQILRATAISCSGIEAVDQLPLDPDCGCEGGSNTPSGSGASCASPPTSYWDGGGQHNESLPASVPSTDDSSFSYNSRFRAAGSAKGILSTSAVSAGVGLLGYGWRSPFDRRVFSHGGDDGRKFVTVLDPKGVATAFTRTSAGVYNQMWPRGTTGASSLQFDHGRGEFVFRKHDSARELRFGDDGRLRSEGRPGLPELTVDWDLQNGRFDVLSSSGLGAAFLLNSSTGLVETIVTDAGSWDYSYTADLHLEQILAPDGQQHRRFHYVNGQMTAVYGPDDVLLESRSYDAEGRVSSASDGSDPISNIEYLPGRVGGEQLTRLTHTSGAVKLAYVRHIAGRARTVEISESCSSCGGGAAVVFAYDSEGRVIRQQDQRGYVTTFDHDSSGRITRTAVGYRPSACDPELSTNCRLTTDALTTDPLTATAALQVTSFTYDDPNWPNFVTSISRSSVIEPGQQTIERLTYDPLLGLVTERRLEGWTGQPATFATRVTTNVYNDGAEPAPFEPGGVFQPSWSALGQPRATLRTSDGPRADVSDGTTYVYYPIDASVPLLLRGRLAAIRNAIGHTTRFEAYDVHGNAIRIVDPNGVATEVTTDFMGRETSRTIKSSSGCDLALDPLCATDITSTSVYGAGGGSLDHRIDPAGAATQFAYDTRGRLQHVSRGASLAQLSERMLYGYDANGWKQTESIQSLDGSWVTRRATSFEYDLEGHLLATVQGGARVSYEYDDGGNLLSVKDENHSAPNTFYGYDPAGRLNNVRQKLGASEVVTRYGYNAAGNLTSVTDPNGNVTTYLYDDFGQMLRQESPVTGLTVYAYDPAGNLTSTIDANGANTTRSYDALGRVVSQTSVSSGTATEAVTWTYDTGAFGLGRLARMDDPTGSTTYAWTRLGQLAREDKSVAGAIWSSSFQYDRAGNRTEVGYPSGRQVSYGFDFAGRPTSAVTGGMTLVSSASYLPYGPLTSIVYGNGTRKDVAHDPRYRPTENKLTGPAGVIAHYQYTYDPASNITAIEDVPNPRYSRTFGYDDLHRLTSAASGADLWGSASYGYDAMGNVTSAIRGASQSSLFSYQSTTPKLVSVTDNGVARGIQYDPSGNETAVDQLTSVYSARNHLLRTADAAYGYDGRGVRTLTTGLGAGISNLTFAAPDVLEGQTVSGTVELSGPAPAEGGIVWLASSDVALLKVPASVTVPPGAATANFAAEGLKPGAVTVTASRAGTLRSMTLEVTEEPRLVTNLILDQASVNAGEEFSGTVYLDRPSGRLGAVVALSSSDPELSLPANITVPEGADRAGFVGRTVIRDTATTVTITASLVAQVTAELHVSEVLAILAEVRVNPQSVVGGHMQPTGTVTLSATAPPPGIPVTLSSSMSSVASVPSSVIVPAEANTASFPVSTSAVSSTSDVTITGVYGATVSTGLSISPCSDWIASPISLGQEHVWFDDAAPAGAGIAGTWNWDERQKTSGQSSHADGTATGLQQHYFWAAPAPWIFEPGDRITTYALLDPCAPPRQLMLQFRKDSWEHRAYWGENLIQGGTDGSASRKRLGDLPPLGEWTRLEVPVAEVGLEGSRIEGMAFTKYDGQVWFDRTGLERCFPTAEAPPLNAADTIWFDDAPPSGASLGGSWSWTSEHKASGTASHKHPYGAGMQQHYFYWSPTNLPLTVGDRLIVYVLLDPCKPPRQLMIQFARGNVWEHRAYWGENLVTWGTDGTSSRWRMGDMPPTGEWLRLEIPASAVGLEGETIDGIAFTLYDGNAWFDRVGKAVGASGSGIGDNERAMSSGSSMGGAPDPAAGWSWGPISLSLEADLVEPLVPRRSSLTAPAKVSIYLPELQLMSESTMTATPAPAWDYVWFGGQPLAQIEVATGAVRTYFNDHLGTPILQTDAAGTVVWRIEHEPYGEDYAFRAGAELHQPLRFPGQEREVGNELAYNVFRWYRGGWGRYSQADPIGLKGSLNLFGYVRQSPPNATDPRGLVAFIKYPTTEHGYPYEDIVRICEGNRKGCVNGLKNPISCECSCIGTGWAARVTVAAAYQVYYAMDHWETSMEAIRDVELKHLSDLEQFDQVAISEAAALEKLTFATKAMCATGCGLLKMADRARRAAYFVKDKWHGH